MVHVLIVEPDDDTCLSLRDAVVVAGARVTIEGSIAGARAALRDVEDVGLLVADTRLPDGTGMEIAREAAAHGIPFVLVRTEPDCLTISNARGTAFRGPVLGALAFLSGLLNDVRDGSRDLTSRWRASADPTRDRARATSHDGRAMRGK
jgi:CheY-like chemotaxis protein